MSFPGSQASPASQAMSWSAWLLLQGFLLVLWAAAFFSAQLLEYEPHASLWFVPSAVTFAGFVAFRAHALPGLFTAAFLSMLLTIHQSDMGFAASGYLTNALMFATIHCGAYAVAALFVLRSIGGNSAHTMLRAVAAFLIGAVVAAFIAGVLGSWSTYWGGLIPRQDVSSLILPWLIGDYAGLLALGPLLVVSMRVLAEKLHIPFAQQLCMFDGLPHPPRNRRALVLKISLMLLTTASGLVAVAWMPQNAPLLFLVYAAILLQLWIVHTQGTVESLVSIALFSTMLAALVAVLGLGSQVLTLQFIMITLAAASYFGLAVPMLYADNADLRKLLIHDSLTGAYSRYFFVELTHSAMEKAVRDEQPLSLLMIDLDYLKQINDQYGHAVGDRVLRALVSGCRKALNSNDLFGRIGGDEFCALLPESDAAAAAASAQRIVATLQTSDLLKLPDGSQPSVSIGVATMTANLSSFETLSQRADDALYQAKRSGRGRVVVAA